MSDDELIALLQGPSSVKDEFTAIHIEARDARLAAKRLRELSDADDNMRRSAFVDGTNAGWNAALGMAMDVVRKHVDPITAEDIAAAIRALRGATEGAGG
jgi:hypothetical protein